MALMLAAVSGLTALRVRFIFRSKGTQLNEFTL